MNNFISTTRNNYHYRAHLEKLKLQVKKTATFALSKSDFNPKDARYRSLKGMQLSNKELFTLLTLQALPIILFVLLLISK